jgi:hypothetical protein
MFQSVHRKTSQANRRTPFAEREQAFNLADERHAIPGRVDECLFYFLQDAAVTARGLPFRDRLPSLAIPSTCLSGVVGLECFGFAVYVLGHAH